MKEYRTERVLPKSEGNAIIYYENFGWKLEDSRETYNESQKIVDTHVNTDPYGRIKTTIDTATDITHYVALRFSRDMDMPNYSKLKALQDEYESMKEPKLHYIDPAHISGVKIFVGILGIIALMIIIAVAIIDPGLAIEAMGILPVIGIAAIVGIVFMIVNLVNYKKNHLSDIELKKSYEKSYNEEKAKYESRQKEILKEAYLITQNMK